MVRTSFGARTTRTGRVAIGALVALLLVLSVATGTAAAQSTGSVTITTDEITSTSASLEVEVTSLANTQSGCLQVRNLDTGGTFERNDVFEGDRFFVFQDEVGGWDAGDTIEATLYDEPSECFTELNSDTQTVQGAADFQVSIDGTNSPVLEGETADVTATITNTGEVAGTQTVNLVIGSFVEDSRSLSLNSGESKQIVLSWQTGQADPASYDASVNSENDFDIASITVQETAPANFEVSIDSTNSPVTEGDTLQITATATNTGGQQGTQDITASASGLGPIKRPVTLDAGESRTETVPIPTNSGDAGTYTVTVQSENDTSTTTVTIQQGTGGSVVDDYRNQNGNVDTGGLQQAINDFIQDPNVGTGDLQAVINAFIAS
jgi:hypothetical protein